MENALKENAEVIESVPSRVILATEDTVAASKFYSSLLGWKDSATGAGISPKFGTLRAMWRIVVDVESIDKTARAIVEAGGKVLQEPTSLRDGRFGIFCDQFGAEFAAYQGDDKVSNKKFDGPGAFVWSELISDDVLASSKFYNSVFGWTLSSPIAGDPGGRREWLMKGRPIAGLLPRPPQMSKEIRPYWDVMFSVSDPTRAVQAASSLGGKNVMPPTNIPHGQIAVFVDPAGIVFSVLKQKESGKKH